MKTHQFRYVLILLTLTLFGVTMFVYSGEAAGQSNGELNSSDQSPEKSPPSETQSTESGTEEQSPAPEHSSDSLQGPLKGPTLIYVIIGAFIVLAIVTTISHVIWDRRLQGKVGAGELLSQEKLDETKQEWKGQLKDVNQQGRDNTQKLEEIAYNHSAIRNEQENLENGLSKLGNRLDNLELKLPNMSSGSVPDKSADVEAIIQEAQAKVESFAQGYEDGEPIDPIEIDDPTPSQRALMTLNWIARTIEDWVNELEQSGTVDPNLIQTLGFANQAIKDKLTEARGPAPLLPAPLDPDTDVSTDTAYNEFKSKCTAYVSRYEGVLIGYQLGRKIDETEYNQFIPQFVKDRLFNGVVRFIKFEQFPEQLEEFLQLVGYEVIPIEIGKTKADARMHDIQSSQRSGIDPGTIVEVVLPGLQRKADGEIVQKPVVIRGE